MENSGKFKMQSITQQYLDAFKRLEGILRKMTNIGNDRVPFREVLKEAEKKNPMFQLKNSLIWDLYALRNVFAHKDRERYIAEVNQLAFESLNELIALLENPPKVGDIFKKEVYSATTDDITEVILRKMKENLYTHVPIYEKGKFIGMLTEVTIFDWLVDSIELGKADFYKQTVGNINRKYLNSQDNLYEFISANSNVFTIHQKFDEVIRKGKRMGAFFITKTGGKNEKLLGIITAWDIPRIQEYLKVS